MGHRARAAEVVAFDRVGRITGEVLDVGCGLGYNALFLAGAGYWVTGVDASPAAIERARALAVRGRGRDQPGRRLNMLCFADIQPDGIPAPLPVAAENVRSTLTGAGWQITGFSPARLLAATASMAEFLDEFDARGKISEDGTIPLPIRSVTADRG